MVVLALSLLVSASACGRKKTVKIPTDLIRQHELIINRASQLAGENQYSQATSTCEDFLQRYPQSPVLDHALFVCGIIYASDQNPERDYKRSLSLLETVSRQIPGSTYAASAQILSHLLTTLKQLQVSFAQENQTLQSMRASDTLQKQTIQDLQAVQLQHLKTIKDLQSEIEKIKRIDLNKRP